MFIGGFLNMAVREGLSEAEVFAWENWADL